MPQDGLDFGSTLSQSDSGRQSKREVFHRRPDRADGRRHYRVLMFPRGVVYRPFAMHEQGRQAHRLRTPSRPMRSRCGGRAPVRKDCVREGRLNAFGEGHLPKGRSRIIRFSWTGGRFGIPYLPITSAFSVRCSTFELPNRLFPLRGRWACL